MGLSSGEDGACGRKKTGFPETGMLDINYEDYISGFWLSNASCWKGGEQKRRGLLSSVVGFCKKQNYGLDRSLLGSIGALFVGLFLCLISLAGSLV